MRPNHDHGGDKSTARHVSDLARTVEEEYYDCQTDQESTPTKNNSPLICSADPRRQNSDLDAGRTCTASKPELSFSARVATNEKKIPRSSHSTMQIAIPPYFHLESPPIKRKLRNLKHNSGPCRPERDLNVQSNASSQKKDYNAAIYGYSCAEAERIYSGSMDTLRLYGRSPQSAELLRASSQETLEDVGFFSWDPTTPPAPVRSPATQPFTCSSQLSKTVFGPSRKCLPNWDTSTANFLNDGGERIPPTSARVHRPPRYHRGQRRSSQSASEELPVTDTRQFYDYVPQKRSAIRGRTASLDSQMPRVRVYSQPTKPGCDHPWQQSSIRVAPQLDGVYRPEKKHYHARPCLQQVRCLQFANHVAPTEEDHSRLNMQDNNMKPRHSESWMAGPSSTPRFIEDNAESLHVMPEQAMFPAAPWHRKQNSKTTLPYRGRFDRRLTYENRSQTRSPGKESQTQLNDRRRHPRAMLQPQAQCLGSQRALAAATPALSTLMATSQGRFYPAQEQGDDMENLRLNSRASPNHVFHEVDRDQASAGSFFESEEVASASYKGVMARLAADLRDMAPRSAGEESLQNWTSRIRRANCKGKSTDVKLPPDINPSPDYTKSTQVEISGYAQK